MLEQQSLFDASLAGNLTVRRNDDLTEWEHRLAARAQFDGLAPVEAWVVNGSSQQLGYATHNAIRFFGKFPPPVARHLIKAHTEEQDVVWDPMCGSGTTGVEALLLNRRAHLMDVSPLNTLIARVKTRHVPAWKLADARERIRREYRPLDVSTYPFEPVGLRNPSHWFLPVTADSLRGLRYLIEEEASLPVREYLWLAFMSTIRNVSRATNQQGRLFLDAKSAKRDALEPFLRRAQRLAEGVGELPVDAASRVKVELHDLKEPVSGMEPQRARLVIMHPPYFSGYKYSTVYKLELAWLGEAHSQVKRSEVREYFKTGKPEQLDAYLRDMDKCIRNASLLLRPGGVLGLMIGDTIYRDQYIPVVRSLLDRISDSDLLLETIALRIPKFTEATWVASQRRDGDSVGLKLCDFVVTLRRSPK